jgi:hypothetical protein
MQLAGEDHVRKAASPDSSERHDVQLLGLHYLVDLFVGGFLLVELVLDDPQVVPERLHEGVDLGVDVPGEEADVPVGEGDDRPREADLLVDTPVFGLYSTDAIRSGGPAPFTGAANAKATPRAAIGEARSRLIMVPPS